MHIPLIKLWNLALDISLSPPPRSGVLRNITWNKKILKKIYKNPPEASYSNKLNLTRPLCKWYTEMFSSHLTLFQNLLAPLALQHPPLLCLFRIFHFALFVSLVMRRWLLRVAGDLLTWSAPTTGKYTSWRQRPHQFFIPVTYHNVWFFKSSPKIVENATGILMTSLVLKFPLTPFS